MLEEATTVHSPAVAFAAKQTFMKTAKVVANKLAKVKGIRLSKCVGKKNVRHALD